MSRARVHLKPAPVSALGSAVLALSAVSGADRFRCGDDTAFEGDGECVERRLPTHRPPPAALPRSGRASGSRGRDTSARFARSTLGCCGEAATAWSPSIRPAPSDIPRQAEPAVPGRGLLFPAVPTFVAPAGDSGESSGGRGAPRWPDPSGGIRKRLSMSRRVPPARPGITFTRGGESGRRLSFPRAPGRAAIAGPA